MMCFALQLLLGVGGEDAGKEWSPQAVETVWGLTDDMVTLVNNHSYYFFKIPHKVSVYM
jgi:hypothetical protein